MAEPSPTASGGFCKLASILSQCEKQHFPWRKGEFPVKTKFHRSLALISREHAFRLPLYSVWQEILSFGINQKILILIRNLFLHAKQSPAALLSSGWPRLDGEKGSPLTQAKTSWRQDFRAQSKLQAVEEAVQKLQVSLRPDNALDTSAKESDSLQLLDEALAGVRMLKDQLGHVSAAYGEIQTRLDNVSAARAAVQGRCSHVLTKLSRGWRFHGGNLYYFSQEKKPWDEAEQFCVSQDSHLTSVSSQVEQEFLSNESKGESHWIGLTDRGTEGIWRWVDGTEFRADASREFWEENQPDNWHQGTGGREDCVEIRPSKLNLWNDANCTLPSRWICKQAHGQAGL
ncbi:C-type lectin domain family 4 member F isoform X2 [Chelonia mydas]|uniref:C-type lectin domain family 4 member F isoform X4 n=1 Tax=Chelonia mydas TaxID=8469 RepID=UPI0018A1E144|nr:C-type lectin domain family 4 member F isoform X4 [Chelonia mydas]XP_037754376.1 C-type lectin domain family 4 member F isoform X2 [Chelonia mydas]